MQNLFTIAVIGLEVYLCLAGCSSLSPFCLEVSSILSARPPPPWQIHYMLMVILCSVCTGACSEVPIIWQIVLFR